MAIELGSKVTGRVGMIVKVRPVLQNSHAVTIGFDGGSERVVTLDRWTYWQLRETWGERLVGRHVEETENGFRVTDPGGRKVEETGTVSRWTGKTAMTKTIPSPRTLARWRKSFRERVTVGGRRWKLGRVSYALNRIVLVYRESEE